MGLVLGNVLLSALSFNSHFSRWTWVIQYQNVSIQDFIGAKYDGGGDDNWNYKTCKAPVKSSAPANQHQAFYGPNALPVTQPTVSKHWMENFMDINFHIWYLKMEGPNCCSTVVIAFSIIYSRLVAVVEHPEIREEVAKKHEELAGFLKGMVVNPERMGHVRNLCETAVECDCT